MNKVEFIMLVGLPGSGKSYLAETFGYPIHSSDAIREELSGDINNQDINQKVFTTLHNRVKEDLKNGISCVYDATNISYKRRKAFLDEIKKIDCHKECIVIATPFEVCLKQNENRERKVPYEVIERMYRNFDIPIMNEGWNKITLHYNDHKYKTLYDSWAKFLYDVMDFDQENPHHTATLGEHCRLCGDNAYEKSKNISDRIWELHIAGALHDCGKPFCKTFINGKGEQDDKAHYYNHENVGSYNSLFYNTWSRNSEERLYIAQLIRWHMQMYFIEKQPHTEQKYKELLGDKLWQDVSILHEADKMSH